MKEFFKMMFASMLGFFIMAAVLFFVFMAIVVAIISFSSEDEVVISSKTVLHIQFDKPITDRAPKNPIFLDLQTMNRQSGLNDILKNIKKAKEDDRITPQSTAGFQPSMRSGMH
jgi:protease IV